MFQSHVHFGIPLRMLFAGGTAYDAARAAFGFEPAYQPRIPRYTPGRPTQPATPPRGVTPTASPTSPAKSRPAVTESHARSTVRGHKCAWPGCKTKVTGRATYCGATCRKRAQRARDKKAGATR